MANFPILYLDDRYASHANWHFSQTSAQKFFGLRGRKCPFTNDAVSAAEDGVVASFRIREPFTYHYPEFRQASLVLEFKSERMVGECELVVKLIYGRNKIPLSPGCQSGLQNSVRANGSRRNMIEKRTVCVHCNYSFFCRRAVWSNRDGFVYNL